LITSTYTGPMILHVNAIDAHASLALMCKMMNQPRIDIQTDPQTNYVYFIIDGEVDTMPL